MNWIYIILEANLYLILFYGLYFFAFKKETYFTLNRAYLVTSVLVSFGIPFGKSETVQSWFITQQVSEQWRTVNWEGIAYAEVVTNSENVSFTWSDTFLWMYIGGATLMLCIFLANLFNVRKLLTSRVPDGMASSFLNKILIDPTIPYADVIQLHEEAHTKELHTLDIIIIELARVICWFNPIAHLVAIEIRKIHEFIADHRAISYVGSRKTYAEILVSNYFKSHENVLVHNFYEKATLKTRLIMIKKKKSPKIAMLKYGMIAPLFIVLLILTSSFVTTNTAEGLYKGILKNQTFKVTELFRQEIDVKGYVRTADGEGLPGASIKIKGTDRITITDLNGQFTFSAIPEGSTLEIGFIGYQSQEAKATEENIEIVLEEAAFNLSEVVVVGYENAFPYLDKNITNEVSLEKQPLFPGGDKELYRFIAQNLRYPNEAQSKKIEGKVIVKFTIDTKGNATNPKILKGLGYGCDEEVIRIISMMPKWTPATQNAEKVAVEYQIPINFLLDKANTKKQEEADLKENIYTSVEDNPQFIGGNKAMYEYIAQNLKYPKAAMEAGVEGRVYVRFVVTKTGTLDNIQVLKGLGHGTEDEVRRVLNTMPKWKPGIQNGRPVNVYFTMPFLFKLTSEPVQVKERDRKYFVNGEEVSQKIADSIDPNLIERVDIKKGEGEYDRVQIRLKDNKSSAKGSNTTTIPYSEGNDKLKGMKGNKSGTMHNPLRIVDGVKMTKEEFETAGIYPNQIDKVNVLKGVQATDKYGPEGANGAIEITLKKKEGSSFTISPSTSSTKEKISFKNIPSNTILVIDGKEVNRKVFMKLDMDKISTINVFKGEQAIKKYGKKAKDGVIEVFLKK